MFSLILFSYQSSKELPKNVDHSLREGALLSAALGTGTQPGETERQGQGSGNMEVQKSLPQRLVIREAERQFHQLHSNVLFFYWSTLRRVCVSKNVYFPFKKYIFSYFSVFDKTRN